MKLIVAAAFATILTAQSAVAQDSSPDDVRPISFTRLVAKLDRGSPWASLSVGILCIPGGSLTWRGGRMDIKTEDLDDVFREEVDKAGFKVEGDPDNLFERQSSTSEYAVAGVMKDIHGKFCAPYAGFYDYTRIKGEVEMEVEWQIYSRLEKRIVARVTTRGTFQLKSANPGGFETIIEAAFAQTVKQLVVSAEFRKAATGPILADNAVVAPEPMPKLYFSPGVDGPIQKIGSTTESVVVVFAGDNLGSGFLISNDGYILTNSHVVGVAKYVKLRWSDGSESLGEVVRLSKGRDVALIKADAHARVPLQMNTEDVQPGDPVYAVGAPLDAKFQSTMTKGIISASRTYGGYNYIQSDVTVNPGNSGGPLMDEHGKVIGITVAGYKFEGAPTGLNLFIPIQDALHFLSLVRK